MTVEVGQITSDAPAAGGGKTPFFIALEGIDGAGKTTIRQALFRHLQAVGEPPLSLTQNSWLVPAATEVLTDVKYLGERRSEDVTAQALVADKAALSRLLIEPHRTVRWVIADRYLLSDVVYQEVLHSIPTAKMLDWLSTSLVSTPDITVLLDTPPDITNRRLNRRPKVNRHWWEEKDIQQRLYDRFFELARHPMMKSLTGEVAVVNNVGPVENTIVKILTTLGIQN